MTKQEKIREGLYKIIIKHDGSLLPQFDWERDLVKQVMEYQDSQGVVIKVERELPDTMGLNDGEPCNNTDKVEAQQEMLKAGYAAVEPLIEGK